MSHFVTIVSNSLNAVEYNFYENEKMDEDRNLCDDNTDMECRGKAPRTHSEFMASIGYEPPVPFMK